MAGRSNPKTIRRYGRTPWSVGGRLSMGHMGHPSWGKYGAKILDEVVRGV